MLIAESLPEALHSFPLKELLMHCTVREAFLVQSVLCTGLPDHFLP